MEHTYVVGVDFGSDSVRAIVVDTKDGKTLSQGTAFYKRWKAGLYQHPDKKIFRQHPRDYLEALEECVRKAVAQLDKNAWLGIVGIGIDTTGSTPAPVNREGVPLALLEEFSECEDAMFHLWKDHSSGQEAEEINEVFSEGTEIDYTKYQGKYCSEWFWAKILHTVRKDEKIREAAYTWIEHCDWMVGELVGETRPEFMYHSACAAGHKALWHSAWDGLPAEKCLNKLDPYLWKVAKRYGQAPKAASVSAGKITEEWARRLNLPEKTIVSGSSFDAHAGAVGAGIRHGNLVCTLGTSAVDMLIEKPEKLEGKNIKMLCGQAEDSIVPGFVGIETGQAAFGDVFAWYKKLLLWPVKQAAAYLEKEEAARLYEAMEENLLTLLQNEAEKSPKEAFPLALDWFNGRRYPDTDDFQTASIGGLTLGVDAVSLYQGLVFGTLCGLKRLVDGFEAEGVEIKQITAVGGIAKKSRYLMQMMADLLGKKVKIVDSTQTCALGAAIYAGAASGIYRGMEEALECMAAKSAQEFVPDKTKRVFYQEKYQEYLKFAEVSKRE